MNSRNSRASCGSSLASRRRRSAGSLICSRRRSMSMLARGNPVCQLGEPARGGAEYRKRAAGFVAQRLDTLPGRAQAEQRDVGRLALYRILARRLAQALRRAFDVEHIVDHLEGEADG